MAGKSVSGILLTINPKIGIIDKRAEALNTSGHSL
jgi:hypothetical protein